MQSKVGYILKTVLSSLKQRSNSCQSQINFNQIKSKTLEGAYYRERLFNGFCSYLNLILKLLPLIDKYHIRIDGVTQYVTGTIEPKEHLSFLKFLNYFISVINCINVICS